MTEKINLNLPHLVDDPGYKIIPFSTEKYCFRPEITNLLIEKGFLKEAVPLEELHWHLSKKDQKVDGDMINNVTRSFYTVSSRMREMYFEMVKHLAREILKFDVIFQETLNMRFHFPGPGNVVESRRAPTGLFTRHLTESKRTAALMLGSRECGTAAISRLCEVFAYVLGSILMRDLNDFLIKFMQRKITIP